MRHSYMPVSAISSWKSGRPIKVHTIDLTSRDGGLILSGLKCWGSGKNIHN